MQRISASQRQCRVLQSGVYGVRRVNEVGCPSSGGQRKAGAARAGRVPGTLRCRVCGSSRSQHAGMARHGAVSVLSPAPSFACVQGSGGHSWPNQSIKRTNNGGQRLRVLSKAAAPLFAAYL